MSINIVKRDDYKRDKELSKLGNNIIILLRYTEKCIRANDEQNNILNTLAMTINKLNRLLQPFLKEVHTAFPSKEEMN